MKIHKIEGDGNCLFRSCSFHLDVCHHCIRRKVSETIKKYPNLPINGKTLKEWIKWAGYDKNHGQNVSRNGVWGSGIELSVIAIMYNRSIEVYKKEITNGRITFKKISEFFPHFGRPIMLLFSGSHYDALTK